VSLNDFVVLLETVGQPEAAMKDYFEFITFHVEKPIEFLSCEQRKKERKQIRTNI
jgi:hypothetical protein